MKNIINYFLIAFSISLLKPLLAKEVIAVVDEYQVMADEVRANEMLVSRIAGEKATKNELALIRKNIEEERITKKIYEYILDKNIEKFEIQISEIDVHKQLDENFAISGVNHETVEQLKFSYLQLADALDMKIQEPNLDSDIIFKRFLSSTFIKKADWEIYYRTYNTKEKVNQLRTLIPKSINDMKLASIKSTERDLLIKKLKRTVFDQSDDELDKTTESEYWNNWLKAQLGRISVTVLDQRFYDFFNGIGVKEVVFSDEKNVSTHQKINTVSNISKKNLMPKKKNLKDAISRNGDSAITEKSENGYSWLFYTLGSIFIVLALIIFICKGRNIFNA